MICGVARFSVRSLVATGVFCAAAFVMVKFQGRSDAVKLLLHESPDAPFMTLPSLETAVTMVVVLVLVIAFYAIAYIVISSMKDSFGTSAQSELHLSNPREILLMAMAFMNALVFALGLGFSGMTIPSKVLGFFDVGGKNFDPSLVFVALGGIGTTMLLHMKWVDPAVKSLLELYCHKLILSIFRQTGSPA